VLSVGQNFTSATYSTDSAALPPDASLGVSSNHVVEFINGRYSVFSKTNSTRLQTKTDLSFWASAGITIPAGSDVTDPRIVFDSASQRWFASMVDIPSSEISNRFLLAVSTNADPTTTWKAIGFTADPVSGYFADFPTMGIDANGVYLAADMSDAIGNNTGSVLVSVPKSALLANPPSAAGRTSFGVLSYNSYGVILQPTVTIGAATSPEAVLAMGDLGYDLLPHSTLLGATIQNAASPGGASLTIATTIPVPQYSIPPYPAQPGAENIDDGDTRFSGIAYRVGNTIYATHSTDVNNRAAIQWFKINALTLGAIETGLITDPIRDLYYPAIAADTNGTVLIVFNASGPTNLISGYAVVGEVINGALTFGNFVLLKTGITAYRTNSILTRWGDYSAVTPDPSNVGHFWALTMFPSSSTAWSTQISELIATPVLLSIKTLSTNVVLAWPVAAAGYQLQSTSSLSPASWTAVPQVPATNNNQLTLSLGVTNVSRLFRLKK
jgi:hypothetical protein